MPIAAQGVNHRYRRPLRQIFYGFLADRPGHNGIYPPAHVSRNIPNRFPNPQRTLAGNREPAQLLNTQLKGQTRAQRRFFEQ